MAVTVNFAGFDLFESVGLLAVKVASVLVKVAQLVPLYC